MNQSSLLRMFQGSFLAFFAYLVTFSVFNMALVQMLNQSADSANRATEVHRLLTRIRNLVLTAESAQRGYLYTDKRDYIISYSDNQAEVETKLDELDRLVDGSSQAAQLRALRPRLTEKFDEMEETIRLQEAKQTERARERVLSGDGKQLMTDVDNIIKAMQDSELKVATDNRERSAVMINWLMGLSIVGLLGFAIFTVWSYRRIAARFLPLSGLVTRSLAISEGDLTAKSMPVKVRDEVGIVTEAYNSMLIGLKRIFARTEQAQVKIREISSRLARSSAEQASSSVQQSTAVQETAVTLEELSQSATQIAERAQEVGGESRATAGESKRGLEAVQESIKLSEKARQGVEDVAQTIVALSQKAQDLEAIVSSVNELAERSNILSINASIQAAAAGSEGVTFSVLANEMRLLANRSKEATVEVKGSLQEIRSGIHKAVMLAEEAVKRSQSGDKNSRRTEETIRNMVESFKKGDEAFQQIVAATRQQSHAFKQVEEALVSIQETATQAEKGSRELEKDSQELIQLSNELHTALSRYENNSDRDDDSE